MEPNSLFDVEINVETKLYCLTIISNISVLNKWKKRSVKIFYS